MTTYTTKIWGQTYGIRANFAHPEDNITVYSGISGEWITTNMQVADFRHDWKEAFEWFLTDGKNMDTIDMDEVREAIDNATITSAIVEEIIAKKNNACGYLWAHDSGDCILWPDEESSENDDGTEAIERWKLNASDLELLRESGEIDEEG